MPDKNHPLQNQVFAFRIVAAVFGLVLSGSYDCTPSCFCAEVFLARTARGKVMAAKGPHEMHNAFRAWFATRDGSQLAELRFATNLTVSFQAAWELVRRSSITSTREDASGLLNCAEHFVGFVEGRLRTQVPAWWREQLRKVASSDRKPNKVQPLDDKKLFSYFSDLDVRMPKDMAIKQLKDTRIVLSAFGKSCTIDRSYFSAAWEEVPVEVATVLFSEDERLYVAFFSNVGGTYPIYCIDTVSGELEWSTTVWAGESPGGGSGISSPLNYVELAISGNSLVVFGRRDDSVYVERFATCDGRATLRFSTTYTSPNRF